jgi:hypothetical protein
LVDKKVDNKEFVGTEDLTRNISKKITAIDELTSDIALCTNTRILAWHVLSLYPGEAQLKLARRESIEHSIASFQKLGVSFSEEIEGEIANVKSRFNREETLRERRATLRTQSSSAAKTLENGAQAGKAAIAGSARQMIEHDRPTTMLFEFSGQELVGAREVTRRLA